MIELSTAGKATRYGILNALGATQHWKLCFNNIPHYDVVGLTGTHNLGAGDLGMQLSLPTAQAVFTEDASSFTFHAEITLYHLFGGIANDIGLRVITASQSNIMQADFLQTSDYLPEGSVSTYGIETLNLTIQRPKLIAGSPVHFIKFEPLIRRNSAGETRVISAHIIFRYGPSA